MRRMSVKEKFFSTHAINSLIIFLFMALPMFLISKLYNKTKEDIWLISERYDEARDNGFHFFKYIRTQEQSINCFYVIDKESKDKKKVAQYGNIIHFGSYKHYLYYYLATKHITTHGSGYGLMPDTRACRLLEKFFTVEAKSIYLKHGILYNNITALTKKRTGIDLFICGALPEYNFVRENFGYEKHEVQYLGLTRFDSLVKSKPKEKQILYMPTWRRWLARLSDDEFKESLFYKNIQTMLDSNQFNDLVESFNLDFKFCLHPRFQKYNHLFLSNNNNVEIVDTETNDIQNLLKSSRLLITDYSSVFFDFAYMKKPIIYYQFDSNKFWKRQYHKGYFNYENHGFGPLTQNKEDCLNVLEKYILSNYEISEKYKKRINKFYPIIDDKNCQRVYKYIMNM